jgi:D-alanyl-D-alanine carboxypeptidase (penicillin-binding protein 5/6)
MAGRCLISAAKKDGKEVISVVMNSDAAGRWEDSTTLLKYGLEN